MSIRERLAGKQRRRLVVPVEVAPVGEDQAARITSAQASLLAAFTKGESDPVAAREAVEAAQAENRADVAFTALEPAEFEKVVAAFPSPDGSDGGMDREKALPVLAALCADDEELQDDEWWSEQFASGSWGYGEQLGLWHDLLALNTVRPASHVPKG